MPPVAEDTAPTVDVEEPAQSESEAAPAVEEDKDAWLTSWIDNEDDDEAQNAAAVKIQSLQRGRKTRAEVEEFRAR